MPPVPVPSAVIVAPRGIFVPDTTWPIANSPDVTLVTRIEVLDKPVVTVTELILGEESVQSVTFGNFFPY